jgi:hypothetical protein
MSETNSPLVVQPGLLVNIEITYPGEIEQLSFVIVPDDQADFSAGFLGEGTLLAQAILGEQTGPPIPYFSGDALSVKILSIEATDLSPEGNQAERRAQNMRSALDQVERTSAMIFASSFSGKWGDYDPKGIENWEQENLDKSTNSDS